MICYLDSKYTPMICGIFLSFLLMTMLAACRRDAPQPFVSAIRYDRSEGVTCTGYPVYFFSDASSNATGYHWDFGDGSTASEARPTHTYTAAGTYVVTLSINGRLPVSRSVYVSDPPPYPFSLNPTHKWRHSYQVTNGLGNSWYLPDTTFALKVIDPITILLGNDTLYYVTMYPEDSGRIEYMRYNNRNLGEITSQYLYLLRHSPDSIVLKVTFEHGQWAPFDTMHYYRTP